MRISSKELLFGQPALKIREILRYVMVGKISVGSKSDIISQISTILDKPKTIAKKVFDSLLLEDFLSYEKKKSWQAYEWTVSETDKGRSLAIARATPPITRAKADELLKELLERVSIINTNNELVFRVQSIKIFGSYLTNIEVLGDLDIGFKLVQRNTDEKYTEKRKERIKLAIENGREFSSFVDELTWPYKEVILMLKTKKKGLSLHNEDDDEIVLIANHKTVFEYKE